MFRPSKRNAARPVLTLLVLAGLLAAAPAQAEVVSGKRADGAPASAEGEGAPAAATAAAPAAAPASASDPAPSTVSLNPKSGQKAARGGAAASAGGNVLRCWQEGRMIYEGTEVLPIEKNAAVITVQSAVRAGPLVQILDLKHGMCVLETRAP